jgi:hypothetical protein
VGKPERKRPLRRQGPRCLHNIKMDLGGIGWDDTDCIILTEDMDQQKTLVNRIVNLLVP